MTEAIHRSAPAGNVERWHGCYDDGWKGLITDASFSHPAKMSRALAVRIFDELFAIGAVKNGDLILDPFAGIGSTLIEASARGLRSIGVELEPKFCALAKQNAELHRRDWEAMGLPVFQIVQGDSRRLRSVLSKALVECIVSSPPYVVIAAGAGGLNTKSGADGQQSGRSPDSPSQSADQRYGEAEGQLARLPVGDVAAIVSSPPFGSGDSASAQSISQRPDKSAAWIKQHTGAACHEGYGATDGQLGEMRMSPVAEMIPKEEHYGRSLRGGGDATVSQDAASNVQTRDALPTSVRSDVSAIVSSPPYEGQQVGTGGERLAKAL